MCSSDLGNMTNSRGYNLIAGGTVVSLVILSVFLLVLQMLGKA